MKKPDRPDDEEVRLEALRAFDILDTEPEAAFDAIVQIASFIADTPIALVSLVDEDRQWFKARRGLEATETSRDVSFCAHAVASGETLIVPDTAIDERFHDNPLVTNDPNIRFYGGAPLRTASDQLLGTLCVIDSEPRQLSEGQIRSLELLADQVALLLEARQQATQWKLDRDAARAFFEASLDLLCVATFEGRFVDLNHAWSDLLGYPMEELLDANFATFIHPDDHETVGRELARLRSSDGELRDFVVRFLTASGEVRRLQFNATALPEARNYIAVARDVTAAEERRLEQEHARLVAEEASRAKSIFLANMSHELRTPLNSVIGFSNLLLKNKSENLNSRDLDFLERIQRNGRHLLTLLNDILDLSKIEVNQVDLREEAIDLVALLEDVHSSLSDPKEQLRLEAPDGLRPIMADELRLRQVVTNLIGNALKFTPEGSVITRIVGEQGAPASLQIIDAGIGISPENLERIFEPFEQEDAGTERRFGGTGLGLPISKALTEAMGFKLTVDSVAGQGSTFSIRFRAANTTDTPAPMKARRVPARRRQTTPPPAEGRPVLIIDDEPESRLLVESAVAELGIPVVAIDTPAFAIKVAEAIRPRLVLLDLMMPVTDGFEILKQFENHPVLKKTPVIVVSIVGPENRDRLKHALEVIEKPISSPDLAQVLQQLSHDTGEVLIVDDDPEARRLVSELVEELGFGCVEAVDGLDALQRVEEQSFVAIILDLAMPNMDGVEFLHRIQGNRAVAEVPIIVFSANPEDRDVDEHAVAVVTKDGEIEQLQHILRGVLDLS